jgi:hypothetical protein
MNVSYFFKRVTRYCKKHGLKNTLTRIVIGLKRVMFENKIIVFYADLFDVNDEDHHVLDCDYSVECKSKMGEMDAQEIEALLSYWNGDIKRRQIEKRFGEGATLWLLKYRKEIAAFRWVIRGKNSEACLFPLTPNDGHLFDAEVFAKYRGRGLDSKLLANMIVMLKNDGFVRLINEIYIWNGPALKSMSKTIFKRTGSARKVSILGKSIVLWSRLNLKEEEKLRSLGV